MRLSLSVAATISLVLLAGCHSKYVSTAITNDTGAKLSVMQVEYPSASFGVQTLEPGGRFSYRFKVYGSGPVKVTWFDAKQQEHHQTGPVLHEGQEGQLFLRFPAQDVVTFQTRVRP